MAIERVVADTGPLVNLSGIGLLELLPKLYGAVWIPEEVQREFATGARPSDPDLATLPWLEVIASVPLDPALPKLGISEAAALSLARGCGIEHVLLDERKARRVAESIGLRQVGTLAVLYRAKCKGLISQLKPHLDAMQAGAI